jgi:tetratricopeptide (TPR) repeat protein
MNQPLLTVDQELQILEGLITGRDYPRKFEDAYHAARRLVGHFPKDPRCWTQLILLCNLIDRHKEALSRQQEVKKYHSPIWTRIHEGDCERDHALYCIRHRKFGEALLHLGSAVGLHQRDVNRTAALFMVRGRLEYARDNYQRAIEWHQQAQRLWSGIPDSANPQWQFNNDRWLLKALVAIGTSRKDLQDLWQSLQNRMSTHGSADINLRLRRLVMKGRHGNLLDDIIESSRGHWVLRRLGFERLARWRLYKR